MQHFHLVISKAHFIIIPSSKLGALPVFPLFVHGTIVHLTEQNINPDIILDASPLPHPLI